MTPKPRRLLFKANSNRIFILCERNNFLSLWALLSSSFIFRFFQMSKLKTPMLDEFYNCQQFIDFKLHNLSRPIIGDIIYTASLKLFKSDSYANLSAMNDTTSFSLFPYYIYIRWQNIIFSSFIPPIITATLLLTGCPLFVSTAAGFLIAFEFGSIIRSRMICVDPLFNFLIAISIFLRTLLQFDVSQTFVFLYVFTSSFSSVIDYSGFVILFGELLSFVFQKRRNIRVLFLIFSFVTLFQVCDLCLEKYFITNLNFSELISQKLQHLISLKFRRIKIYTFPLWKFIPRLLWSTENQHIYLFNNPVVILFSTLFCAFGIRKRLSIFYFLSIWFIWLLKRPTSVLDYQISLFFSAISIGQLLQNFPLRNICSFIMLLFLALAFSLWAPWIYGLKISPQMNSILNIWDI